MSGANAFSMRSAISGVSAALPCSRSESVARRTFKISAAFDTLRPDLGQRAIDSTFAGGGFILFAMTLSARNRLAGEIVELEFGGVMAHVVVRVGQDLIESVITKRSAEEMKLKIGDKVSAVIKSTEVMLEKS
jgi:molybdopterin-binding protein